nr:immunoglobulin light chain junction region [Macaca mulatta]MOY17698.1 immunoglobulin light chain junction region [Macaca mulatta]
DCYCAIWHSSASGLF